MKFCPHCGNRIKTVSGQLPQFCSRCGTVLDSGQRVREASLVEDFPFKTLRPMQREVMDQVESALRASKRFIILEAPVGFGKSAVAAALCNHLGSAYLLTSTKQLQDQYSRDFGYSVVIGKSNFTCLVPTAAGKLLACSKGRCEVDWKLSECPHYLTFEEYDEHRRRLCIRDSKCEHLKDGKCCSYYEQKWEAFKAPVMVANYPFFMTELRYTDDIKRRRLLVCDESHDLEKQIVGFASFSFRKSTLESFREDGHDGAPPMIIPNVGDRDAKAWKEPLSEAGAIFEQFLDKYLTDGLMQDRVASCKATLDSLNCFLEDLDSSPDNWIVSSVRTIHLVGGGTTVEEVAFQPLEVGAYTSPLFDSAETTMLMSATVFSKEAFCKALGITEREAMFIRIKDSSFPVENRKIYALNAVHLNKATMDASLGLIARVVDEIMARHIGERGIVHTTSYQQARYVMEHVSEANKRRLQSTENVSSRTALLAAHGSKDESVLISPSLYQGVDLKDGLSRFQVLVKVPYPDLSDKRTRVKLERDPAWYDWQTALRLVQTYGRSVRSETDHAVTYVLDSNFTTFLNRHRQLLPEYFLEALATLTDT